MFSPAILADKLGMLYLFNFRISSKLKSLFDGEKIPDINDQNNPKRFTPLMAAVAKGEYTLAKALLELGPDINKQNRNGDTALIIAMGKANSTKSWTYDLIELLIVHDADARIVNNEGNRACQVTSCTRTLDVFTKALKKSDDKIRKLLADKIT